MKKEIPIDVTVYMVRNQEGKWFRAKGLSGWGDSWVDDIKNARIYTKVGPARSCVTWWTNHYPEYGIPDIIEVNSTVGIIMDEATRVKNAVNKIKKEKEEHEKRSRENDIKYLQEKLKNTRDELNKLMGGK